VVRDIAGGRIALCLISDLKADRGYKVQIDDDWAVAVFGFEGAFFVIDDRCTHGLGSLSDGKVKGDQVICPFHRGAFNYMTGEATVRPCTVPVKTYRVEISGDTICIADPRSPAC
jgi:ethylbenzene dioxygenase ferredoxin component